MNKMRKFTIAVFAFIISLGFILTDATAQTSEVKDQEAYKRQLQVYQDAMKYNDVSVAKNALYNLRAIDPSNISLLDTLAYLYFEYQQYASSLLVSRDIVAKNPNHLSALQIQAVSYEKLGLRDQALSTYESLYLKKNSPYTLYKIGMLQFDLKRHTESKTSLDILLGDPAIDELNVVVTGEGNVQKEVPMRAALLNFQGLNQLELGDKAAAKENFEAALKLAPEYANAKENLAKI